MNAHESSLSEAKSALLAMTAEAAELQNAVGGSITDAVADWLGPHYALAARERLATAKADERLEILRAFVQDWALLRRGDHYAERLEIERGRLEVERQRSEERQRAEFEKWLKEPGAKKRLCGEGLTPEERERRLREVFDLPEERRGGLSPEAPREIERAANTGDPTASE